MIHLWPESFLRCELNISPLAYIRQGRGAIIGRLWGLISGRALEFYKITVFVSKFYWAVTVLF